MVGGKNPQVGKQQPDRKWAITAHRKGSQSIVDELKKEKA